MRYSPYLLLLGILLPGSLVVNAAVNKTPDSQMQSVSARTDGGTRGSVAVARAVRSGPVFGLAAIAAFTATRAARDPVPVFAPTELVNHSPIAAASAANTLLNTVKTTTNGTSLLPVVTPVYAEAIKSKSDLDKFPVVKYRSDASSVQKLLAESLRYIGVPYRWGGTSPTTGLDCSGLTQLVFHNAVGINLPRTAIEQSGQGSRVSLRELRAGDLVFFNTIGENISHVGVYVGGGKFLHAPATGKFVRIDKIYSRFWGLRYVTARRMVDDHRDVTRLAAAPVAAE